MVNWSHRGIRLIAHSSEGHEAPPEALHVGPGVVVKDVESLVVVADGHSHPKLCLADVDEAGEGEDGDAWRQQGVRRPAPRRTDL